MGDKKFKIGEAVGRSAGALSGIALIILSLIASPFVLWMAAGDDEGSSWSLGSIIAIIIVVGIFVGGIALLRTASKRNDDEKEISQSKSTNKLECDCGAKNPKDAKFCNKCGRPLDM